jgi:hypothetical protein
MDVPFVLGWLKRHFNPVSFFTKCGQQAIRAAAWQRFKTGLRDSLFAR